MFSDFVIHTLSMSDDESQLMHISRQVFNRNEVHHC